MSVRVVNAYVLEIPEFQLPADPDPPVSGTGTIEQTLTGKAVLPAGSTSEYQFRCRYSEYSKVRVFN